MTSRTTTKFSVQLVISLAMLDRFQDVLLRHGARFDGEGWMSCRMGLDLPERLG